MPRNDDHRRAADRRLLGLRARGDLESIEVAYSDQSSFIVKDPVANHSFQLMPAEHRLLLALRAPVSLRDLQRVVETEFAPRRASTAELQVFIARLYDQGLLVAESPGQGAELLARSQDRRRRSRWTSALQVLAIRLGRFNPTALIDRLYAAVGWLTSPWALLAAAAIVFYAVAIVVSNSDAIASRLPSLSELAQPRRWPLWIVAIAAVKIVHELAHALVARRFGVRAQEMGLLLLAGAPALYCDVSDAWRLRSKWQRMAISGAGMAAELVIAAISVIVWWHAAPGLLSAICLSLVTVCTIGTVAINANPLLRYDGYYLLADWLEVPNLAERSRGLASSAWRQWLLGEPASRDALLGPGKRRTLWLYTVLSKAYLAAILIGLLVLGVALARPRGLENAVYTLAAVIAAGMLIGPLASAARLAGNPSVRMRLRRTRLAVMLAAIAALGAAVWHWPVAHRVDAPLVVVPQDARPLFAVAPGELVEAAPVNAWVDEGAVIARLANPELELALVRQQAMVRERRLRVAHLRTLQATQGAAARLLPTAIAELSDAEAQLAVQKAMVDSMTIRAPVAGRVLAPPRRGAQTAADRLPTWTGSPLDARNRGAWFEAGTPLAVIAPAGAWMAWAAVDQSGAAALAGGSAVRVLVDEHPTRILEGRVTHVSGRAQDNRRVAEPGADGKNRRDAALFGDDRYHVVELDLGLPTEATLFAGARGMAKITLEQSTLGAVGWLHLRRAFTRVW